MIAEPFCPASGLCWRYAYSKYVEDGNPLPLPSRGEMFRLGYACFAMTNKGGIYAESLAACPKEPNGCPEYSKYLAKQRFNNLRFKGRKQALHRDNISKELRSAIARRDKYTCVYCGRHHNQIDNYGRKVRGVIDHFVPLALHGLSDETNLVFACFECNSAKSDSLWERGCRQGYYDRP